MTMRERPLSGLLACFCFAIVFANPVESAAETQCTCRAASQSYAEGTCACLDRPGSGSEIACCGKVLNNTSWKFTGKGCPVAGTEPAAPTRLFSLKPASDTPAIRISTAASAP